MNTATITATATGLTIRIGQTFLSVRRNAATKDVETHHNLEGANISAGLSIQRTVRQIMKANSRASYEQRFAKAAKMLVDANTKTYRTISNHLTNSWAAISEG